MNSFQLHFILEKGIPYIYHFLRDIDINESVAHWVIELEEIYLIRQITEICVTEPHSSRTRGVIPARYSYITLIVSKTPRNHKLLNYYDTFLITK